MASFEAPNSQSQGPLFSGPMVGDTTSESAIFWAQARDTEPLTLTLTGPGAPPPITLTPKPDNWLIVTYHVTGLLPGATYRYSLTSKNGVVGPFQFTTFNENPRKLKIALGSCFHFWDRDLPIFSAIENERPDLFLMLGDNAYYDQADWQNENTKMACQLKYRNNRSQQKIIRNIPTLAIWDDHDFGPNDADSTFSGKPSSLSTFRRMWPQPQGGIPNVDALFFSRRIGLVEIFLLDVRSFRLHKQIVLGSAQMNWLIAGLKSSTAPIKLVLSGSQFLPTAPAAVGWESFQLDGPKEREQLLKAIDDNDIQGVVFATGDVHIGYLLCRVGEPRSDGRNSADIWELTTSPIANDPWFEDLIHKVGPYDPTLYSEVVAVNYGVIDIDLDRPGAEVALSLRGENGRVLSAASVSLKKMRRRNAPPEKMAGCVWPNGKAYFFKGGKYVRWDIAAHCVDAGYPMPITRHWQGLKDQRYDAAIPWNNGKAYFFKGNGYATYLINADKATPEIQYIGRYWKGLWQDGVDAAVFWNNGKAYFFRGAEYIRYDIAQDRTDPGYPKTIASGWSGVWSEGIEAVLLWPNGKAYFFRGSEYIQYDLAKDHADPGYPKPIATGFPGLFNDPNIA